MGRSVLDSIDSKLGAVLDSDLVLRSSLFSNLLLT
jgi:hypothetical protein